MHMRIHELTYIFKHARMHTHISACMHSRKNLCAHIREPARAHAHAHIQAHIQHINTRFHACECAHAPCTYKRERAQACATILSRHHWREQRKIHIFTS